MKSVCIWSWTGFDETDHRFLSVKNTVWNTLFLSPLKKGTDSFCIWHGCDPITAKDNWYPPLWSCCQQQGRLSGGTPASARISHTDSQQWIQWVQSVRGTTSVFEKCSHQIRTLLKLLKFLSQYLNVTARWSNKWQIIYITFPRLGLLSVIYTSDAGFGFIPVVSVSSEKAGNNNNNNH